MFIAAEKELDPQNVFSSENGEMAYFMGGNQKNLKGVLWRGFAYVVKIDIVALIKGITEAMAMSTRKLESVDICHAPYYIIHSMIMCLYFIS